MNRRRRYKAKAKRRNAKMIAYWRGVIHHPWRYRRLIHRLGMLHFGTKETNRATQSVVIHVAMRNLRELGVEPVIIDNFDGEYRFMSNFYSSPVELDGVQYRTVEHAYQAAKTLDHNLRSAIANAGGPSAARRFGRTLKLRPDWEEVKVSLMRTLIADKFKHGSVMAGMLLATGDAVLVEGNYWHDNFWGSCKCKKCGDNGQNRLGIMLTRQRAELTGRR